MTENEEEIEEKFTIDVVIPIPNEAHQNIVEQLEEEGLSIEKVLGQRLQPQAENELHNILQEGRYQRP